MQIVELAYRSPLAFDPQAIAARATELFGAETALQFGAEAPHSALIAHPQQSSATGEPMIPPATSLVSRDEGLDAGEYALEIQQAWTCEDPMPLLEGTVHRLTLMEMIASQSPPAQRLKGFHRVLQAAVELTKPDVMVSKHTQQVIAPAEYLESCSLPDLQRLGAHNVRFYRISNSNGDMLMDTRGMEEIGLHDIQCHFREMDPNDVANVLRNISIFLIEQGPGIESGHTVPGAQPGSKWLCQFEDALVEPQRTLLDVHPGEGFAAGNR